MISGINMGQLVDNFKQSDLISLHGATGAWRVHLDPALVGDTTGDFSVPAQCIPKPVGPLSMALLPSEFDLNLPIPLPAVLHFDGTEVGPDAAGNPQIRWAIDQIVAITV